MSGARETDQIGAGLGRSMLIAYLLLFALLGAVAALPRLTAHPAAARNTPAGLAAEPSPNPSALAALAADRSQTTVTAASDGPVGWLTIPALQLADIAIYDRGLDAQRRMQIAPGLAVTHYSFSSPLGGPANAVLYGHDDIEGGVFGKLKQLKPGDTITVRLPSGTTQQYTVTGQRLVPPTAISILDPTPTATLTLFSCWPLYVDNQRIVVTAVPTA
ncbi:MAG TPA: sortase [Candidatus Dormibacteraeota bacterium]|nr:sortase [Candidatus Dormibacteraeota bacterium]